MEKLEIHYYLENNYHSMDAFVKNKAEAELLIMFKEISELLSLDLTFEIEALEQGGIREFFKVLQKPTNKKKLLQILAFAGVIFSGVVTNIISDKINGDSEMDKLKKEETILHIKKLKQELEKEDTTEQQAAVIIENLTIILSNTDKIRVHRSNFYSTLLKDRKIEKVSMTELDNYNNPLSTERFVNRIDFDKFIIEEIKLEPEYIENANIEIVAPVLNRGNIKWKGIYNDKPISFNLIDTEFKNSVLNREISFANGTSIQCTIELEKTIDDSGEIKIKEINVSDVLSVFEGNVTNKTQRAKRLVEEKRQTKIDFDKTE